MFAEVRLWVCGALEGGGGACVVLWLVFWGPACLWCVGEVWLLPCCVCMGDVKVPVVEAFGAAVLVGVCWGVSLSPCRCGVVAA